MSVSYSHASPTEPPKPPPCSLTTRVTGLQSGRFCLSPEHPVSNALQGQLLPGPEPAVQRLRASSWAPRHAQSLTQSPTALPAPQSLLGAQADQNFLELGSRTLPRSTPGPNPTEETTGLPFGKASS